MIPINYKYGSLMGVVALILLFVNWIIDTSLIRKANSIQDSMDKMWNERWIYDGLNTIIDEQKNQSLSLYQLNDDKGIPDTWEKRPESREFFYLTRDLGISANFPPRLTDLLKFAWRTQELSQQIPETEKYREEINGLVDSLNSINREVQNTKKSFDSTRVALFGQQVAPGVITFPKLDTLRQSSQPYQKAVRKFNYGYLEYKNKFLLINTRLYQIAKEKSIKSRTTSSNYSSVAIWIYVLASILAILGKWFDIKQKERERK